MGVFLRALPADHDVKNFLLGVLGDDAGEVFAECEAGEAQLIEITGEAAGVAIIRLEQYENGDRELVIVAGKGHGMADFIDRIRCVCADRGVGSIRVHSSRAGYGRHVKRMGFELIEKRLGECVYRLKV